MRRTRARAVEWLGKLPASVVRMGGSLAQRDVSYVSLMNATERLRRPEMRFAA